MPAVISGVYAQETPPDPPPIPSVATSIAAFVGEAPEGPVNQPVAVAGLAEFEGRFDSIESGGLLAHAVRDFFRNGGAEAIVVRVSPRSDGGPPGDAEFLGSREERTGIYALLDADVFHLLCLPRDVIQAEMATGSLTRAALQLCVERRAVLLLDPPTDWRSAEDAAAGLSSLGLSGAAAANAALYFPRLSEPDPLTGRTVQLPPCGAVAGVFARRDAARGVWIAPAGVGVPISGGMPPAIALNDDGLGRLSALGVNCLRSVPGLGTVVWAARTLAGADADVSAWKYLPVRRMALFLEESLDRGTRWAVFEPNDEPLWSRLRASVAAFLHVLFEQGAFRGTRPEEAYFVKCDRQTMTQSDLDQGIVNVVVGFAPLPSAEFIVITIRQFTHRDSP